MPPTIGMTGTSELPEPPNGFGIADGMAAGDGETGLDVRKATGSRDGAAVGDGVGVGVAVGVGVGVGVGDGVGVAVGRGVGRAVGRGVGAGST